MDRPKTHIDDIESGIEKILSSSKFLILQKSLESHPACNCPFEENQYKFYEHLRDYSNLKRLRHKKHSHSYSDNKGHVIYGFTIYDSFIPSHIKTRMIEIAHKFGTTVNRHNNYYLLCLLIKEAKLKLSEIWPCKFCIEKHNPTGRKK